MTIDRFAFKLRHIKEERDKRDFERQKFDEQKSNEVVKPTENAVELWNQVERALDEWEDQICSYLKVMGDLYWETTESTVVKIDRIKAKKGFYKSTVLPFLDALSRPWIWYVEGPWEPYYIGQVRPVFGVCMNMSVLPKEKVVNYYFTVDDRGGKTGKYTTLEELETRLIEAFERGPHIPGQKC